MTWTNWGRTVTAEPARVVRPRDADEVVAELAAALRDGLTVKPVGAGHSFTSIAATDGVQIDPSGLTGIRGVDGTRVRVGAGTRLAELSPALWERSLAMANLGDIDVQTLAGAVSTGTHGTGARLGGIATQVVGVQLVTADGRVLDLEHGPEFETARLGLGACGVLTELTLQCVPAFALHADERPDRLENVLAGLDEWVAAHDHVEFYWFPHTDRVLTKTNDRVGSLDEIRPVPRWRHLVDDELLSNGAFEVVNRIGTAAPSRIPTLNALSARALSARSYTDRGYRVFSSPRRVRFREMEYAIPRAALPEVLRELDARLDEPISFPVEVRFAAADDVWLSTAYGRETAYVAVHQYHRRPYQRYFAMVESLMAEHGGRPHWGKLHGLGPDRLRTLYPRFGDALAVRDKLDPQRLFANAHLDRVLGA